jgi:mycothiol system anti-sigma-R factor
LDCQESQELIHAYVDGELELAKHLGMERHLQGCSVCAQAHTNQQTLRSALKTSSLYFQAPANLRQRVQTSVRRASKTAPAIHLRQWQWLSVAAALVCIALTSWSLIWLLPSESKDELLVKELLASRVRSQLLASHRVDVASSDQHTVKPWFEGKVDFAPVVKDLAAQGFPFIGGRLDYVADRPAAVLVYQRHKHFIDLFMWPASEHALNRTMTRQGYNLFRWTQSGLTFWAISDLNDKEMQEFLRLVSD